MLKIGITGQAGFIGRHLYNTVGLFPAEFERVDFKKDFFEDERMLDAFVSACDVIVHLAAKNRHNVPEVIFETNVELVNKLVASLTRTKSKAHVLFSSSIQEERDNHYGQSKKEGRNTLKEWSVKAGTLFTGMIIPNVFGPFGHPKYNSVVATFCHQLANNETPVIDNDGELRLIYVGELVKHMLDEIRNNTGNPELIIADTYRIKLSDLLDLLNRYKKEYQEKGIIPAINNDFELNLFNTYRCYIPLRNYFPVKFNQHKDARGAFVEIIRLNEGGQVSFSTTHPSVTRGNHFHTRKIERFAVIKGKALIRLRKIDTEEVLEFHLSGDEPAYVDMPIWYTHNIKNTGEEDLYTIFWINEFFNPADPDTFLMDVEKSSI
jgi:UDP-2-acetamido-2,6-beta-L-arabino-hexul-4-ose reductase